MSKFSKFMKQNKKVRENAKVAVSELLVDEKGNPLEWEIRPLTSAEVGRINNECTTEKTLPNGTVRRSVNGNKLTEKLICESVVVPDLLDADLQDSYGVKTPEDLIHQLLDDPGEYNALAIFIQQFNHLGKTLDEKVEEAKN
jgi:hypothetical protein